MKHRWLFLGLLTVSIPLSAQRADSVRVQSWFGGVMTSQTFVLGALPPVIVPPVVVPPPGTFVVPALPDTFTVPAPGRSRVVLVAAGSDLQAVLNTALAGDEIVLADSAVWTGNYVLPKANAAWVIIRSETCASGPATPAMPHAKIVTPNSDAVIRSAPGAAQYRLQCVEIAHKPGSAYNYGLVVLGRGDETTLAALPRDIVLDRVYIHGSTTDGNSRCVAFNGARLAIIDSYVSECHAKGADAQGVGGWGGPGPFLISGNRIEASGQCIMFGGADPKIPNVSPSNITVTRNYCYKPLSWGGGKWTVKAAFELKHGKRVLVEGNVFENHWADAQTGFAMLLQTLADQNTSWAWTTVQDITIRNNLIRNSTSGVNMLARVAYNGGTLPTNPTARVWLDNNLFQNVGRDPVSGAAGISVQLLGDLVDASVTRNTFTGLGSQKVVSFDGLPEVRTTVTDNVFAASSYQVWGSAKGIGQAPLDFYIPGGLFKNNTVPGLPGTLGAQKGAGVDTVRLNAAIKGVVR